MNYFYSMYGLSRLILSQTDKALIQVLSSQPKRPSVNSYQANQIRHSFMSCRGSQAKHPFTSYQGYVLFHVLSCRQVHGAQSHLGESVRHGQLFLAFQGHICWISSLVTQSLNFCQQQQKRGCPFHDLLTNENFCLYKCCGRELRPTRYIFSQQHNAF